MELKIKISDEETLTTELPEVLTLDEFRVWLKKFEKYSEVFVSDNKAEKIIQDTITSINDKSVKLIKKYKKLKPKKKDKREYIKTDKWFKENKGGRPKVSSSVNPDDKPILYMEPKTKKFLMKHSIDVTNKPNHISSSGIVPSEEAYKETIREFKPGQNLRPGWIKEISKDFEVKKEPEHKESHKGAAIVPIDATEIIKRLRNDRDLVLKLYTIYYKGSPEDFNSFCQAEHLDSVIKDKEKLNVGFGWARVYHGISPEEVGVEKFT